MDASEAKTAFLRLAYTKFKDLPLYLEWAPVEALSDTKSSEKKESSTESTYSKMYSATLVP